jgi:hypothetical protein
MGLSDKFEQVVVWSIHLGAATGILAWSLYLAFVN